MEGTIRNLQVPVGSGTLESGVRLIIILAPDRARVWATAFEAVFFCKYPDLALLYTLLSHLM